MLMGAMLIVATLTAFAAIHALLPVAERVGILDKPCGHKMHTRPVPFIGGFGVFASLIVFFVFAHFGLEAVDGVYLSCLAACLLVMFLTGFADDKWHLSFRVRLLIEAAAALVMIHGAGVVLGNLGTLVPSVEFTLGMFAVPFTIFCVIGVTNAFNMVDGIDGLSGSISLVSFVLLALLAYSGDNAMAALLAVTGAGAMLGFLRFNIRMGAQQSARVYLGDNGSTVTGFLLGWLFVDLSQGHAAEMSPVTALYLFAFPLFDSVMAITRRIWLGKSPFKPDRSHLHHMLLDAGASVRTTVLLLVGFHATLALIGVGGEWLGSPDSLMFAVFMGMFLAYGYVISRPWRFVPRMRRAMVRVGIPLEHGTGVFIGRFDYSETGRIMARVRGAVGPDVSVRVFSEKLRGSNREAVFLVVDVGSWRAVRPAINRIRRKLSMIGTFEIRQYVLRRPGNDCRRDTRSVSSDRRKAERRGHIPIREIPDSWLENTAPPVAVARQPIAA